MTDLKNSVLFSRADPQVPMVHQKFGSMLFWCDRIVMNILKYFNILDVHLNSDRRTGIFFYSSVNYQRRFLTQGLRLFKYCLIVAFEHDALDDSRSVAQLKKNQLSA